MRTYLSPVGFDSRRVTRPTLNYGVDQGDRVVLIRPDAEPDDRAAEAINDVRNLLEEVEPDVGFSTVEMAHQSLEAAVLESIDLLRAADGERIVCLGGGARDVLLPMTIAALTAQPLVDTVLFFSDLSGEVREWHLPALGPSVPSNTEATFEAIGDAEDWTALSTVAEQVDAAKSTVTRHVNSLESANLVESRTESRHKQVRLSFAGKLLERRETL